MHHPLYMKGVSNFLTFYSWEDGLFGCFYALRSNVSDEKIDFLSIVLNNSFSIIIFLIQLFQLVPYITFVPVFSCNSSAFCIITAILQPSHLIGTIGTSGIIAAASVYLFFSFVLLCVMIFIGSTARRRNLDLQFMKAIVVTLIVILSLTYSIDLASFAVKYSSCYNFLIDSSGDACYDSAHLVILICSWSAVALMFCVSISSALFLEKFEFGRRLSGVFAHGNLEVLYLFYRYFSAISWAFSFDGVSNAARIACICCNLVIALILFILQVLTCPCIHKFENHIRASITGSWVACSLANLVFLSSQKTFNEDYLWLAFCIGLVVGGALSSVRSHMMETLMSRSIGACMDSFDSDLLASAKFALALDFGGVGGTTTRENAIRDGYLSIEHINILEGFKTSQEFVKIKKSLIFSTDLELLVRQILINWCKEKYQSTEKEVIKLALLRTFMAVFSERHVSAYSVATASNTIRICLQDFNLSSALLQTSFEMTKWWSPTSRYACFCMQKHIDTSRVEDSLQKSTGSSIAFKNIKASLADSALFRKSLQSAKFNHERAIKGFQSSFKLLINDERLASHGKLPWIQIENRSKELQKAISFLSIAENHYLNLQQRFPNNSESVSLYRLFKNQFFKDDTANYMNGNNEHQGDLDDDRNSICASSSERGGTIISSSSSNLNGFGEKESTKSIRLNMALSNAKRNFKWTTCSSIIGLSIAAILIVVSTIVIVSQLEFVMTRIDTILDAEKLFSELPESSKITVQLLTIQETVDIKYHTPGDSYINPVTLDFYNNEYIPTTQADWESLCTTLVTDLQNAGFLDIYSCIFATDDLQGVRMLVDRSDNPSSLFSAIESADYRGNYITSTSTEFLYWTQVSGFVADGKITAGQTFLTGAGMMEDNEMRDVFAAPIMYVSDPLVMRAVIAFECQTLLLGRDPLIQRMQVIDSEFMASINNMISVATKDDNSAVLNRFLSSSLPVRVYDKPAIASDNSSSIVYMGLQEISSRYSASSSTVYDVVESQRATELRMDTGFRFISNLMVSDTMDSVMSVVQLQIDAISEFISKSISIITAVIVCALVVLIASCCITIYIIRSRLHIFDSMDQLPLGPKIILCLSKDAKKTLYSKLKLLKPPRDSEDDLLEAEMNDNFADLPDIHFPQNFDSDENETADDVKKSKGVKISGKNEIPLSKRSTNKFHDTYSILQSQSISNNANKNYSVDSNTYSKRVKIGAASSLKKSSPPNLYSSNGRIESKTRLNIENNFNDHFQLLSTEDNENSDTKSESEMLKPDQKITQNSKRNLLENKSKNDSKLSINNVAPSISNSSLVQSIPVPESDLMSSVHEHDNHFYNDDQFDNTSERSEFSEKEVIDSQKKRLDLPIMSRQKKSDTEFGTPIVNILAANDSSHELSTNTFQRKESNYYALNKNSTIQDNTSEFHDDSDGNHPETKISQSDMADNNDFRQDTSFSNNKNDIAALTNKRHDSTSMTPSFIAQIIESKNNFDYNLESQPSSLTYQNGIHSDKKQKQSTNSNTLNKGYDSPRRMSISHQPATSVSFASRSKIHTSSKMGSSKFCRSYLLFWIKKNLCGPITRYYLISWLVVAVLLCASYGMAISSLLDFEMFEDELKQSCNLQQDISGLIMRTFDVAQPNFVPTRDKSTAEIRDEFSSRLDSFKTSFHNFVVMPAHGSDVSVGRRTSERETFVFGDVCISPIYGCDNLSYSDAESTMEQGLYKGVLAWTERAGWLESTYSSNVNDNNPSGSDYFLMAYGEPTDVWWLIDSYTEVSRGLSYLTQTLMDEASDNSKDIEKKQLIFMGCILAVIVAVIVVLEGLIMVKREKQRLQDAHLTLRILSWAVLSKERIFERFLSESTAKSDEISLEIDEDDDQTLDDEDGEMMQGKFTKSGNIEESKNKIKKI